MLPLLQKMSTIANSVVVIAVVSSVVVVIGLGVRTGNDPLPWKMQSTQIIPVIVYASRDVPRGLTQILMRVCVQGQDQTQVRNPSQMVLHCRFNGVIVMNVFAAPPRLLSERRLL